MRERVAVSLSLNASSPFLACCKLRISSVEIFESVFVSLPTEFSIRNIKTSDTLDLDDSKWQREVGELKWAFYRNVATTF